MKSTASDIGMKTFQQGATAVKVIYSNFAGRFKTDKTKMEHLRPIMLAGTGSDVGKSVLAAALCRIFRQDGYTPAPFKAQNMALNSAVTPDGLEIGRAQAVQAEAAGVAPTADMNPVLLKPTGDMTSQVVLNGRATGNSDAYSYYNGQGREELRRAACDAFDRLAATYNPIVMEGAGSIAEINLSDRDIVNMPMARHAGAAVVLVADIDRGGVFASAYGSIMLQGEADRRLIKGIIVNKFRGDMRLFDDGVKMMERICGVPVLGVVPYFDDIHIEAEDSVALAAKAKTADGDGRVQVGVVMLRHMSNFTDFDALERDPRVHLFYTCDPREAAKADIIIVPGSKNTIADLGELRRNGMAEAVTEAWRRGKTVLGICGGYQMLGAKVADPDHVEGDTERTAGLGLLPVSTRLDGTKTTRRTEFTIAACGGARMTGYEIHNGVTSPTDDKPCTPLCTKADGTTDGCIADNKCMGTYMHGILDNAAFIDFLLAPYATTERLQAESYAEFKARQYDRLAEFVRRHVDMEKVYGILGGKK